MATVIVNKKIRPGRLISWRRASSNIAHLDELARLARLDFQQGRTVALRDLLSQANEARGKAIAQTPQVGVD